MSHFYQIHNHRDRVHNVVGFTFAGPRHKLVGHRYEIYISQIAINLFPLMKILSFHYHRHKTLSDLTLKQNGLYNTRNRNCLPFMNILCHPPSPPPGLFGVHLFSFLRCDFCSVSCHQCFLCLWFVHSRLSINFPLTFIYMKCYEVNSHPWLGVLDTTVYDNVCQ